jgi:Prp8 binding protein
MICSSSSDGMIMLWNAYNQVENIGVFKREQAILQIQFSRDSSQIYSCSVDGTLGIWDINAGERVGRLRGHRLILH